MSEEQGVRAGDGKTLTLPYSMDLDPAGIRALVSDAISGALALGAQNESPAPEGHWLAHFWQLGRQHDEWRATVWAVARALNCLPSTFSDANGHVLRAAERLMAELAAAPAAAPAEHLPTKEHIRELAQEALDQIMEQAQVFASAWSLVGGKFDDGNALSDAEDAKAELRTMVRSLADLAAETVRPAASPAALTRKQIDDIMTQHYPLESLLRESVDAFEACVRDIEKALGVQAPATADGSASHG